MEIQGIVGFTLFRYQTPRLHTKLSRFVIDQENAFTSILCRNAGQNFGLMKKANWDEAMIMESISCHDCDQYLHGDIAYGWQRRIKIWGIESAKDNLK